MIKESYYTRNAKFYAIDLTSDFVEVHGKQVKIMQNICNIIKTMLKEKKIKDISGNNLEVEMADGIKMTKAKFRDYLVDNYDVFNTFDAIENRNKSAERGLVTYVLERYSSYFKRNGHKKVPTINIQNKTFYLKDTHMGFDFENNLLTVPTLYGSFDLKYYKSLKQDKIDTTKNYGGNISIKQKCYVAGVKIKFLPAYEPKSFLGFDLNKDLDNWMVFSDGAKISADENIRESIVNIRNYNKLLDADRKLPVKDRKIRTKERSQIRKKLKEEKKRFKSSILKIINPIIDRVEREQMCLCIDSVKTGQQNGTFGQDVIPSEMQSACENRGIPFYIVPCAYTSQECSICNHVSKESRKNKDEFVCVSCGTSIDAQFNAAMNIKSKGQELYKANVPYQDWTRPPFRRSVKTLVETYGNLDQ